MFYKIKVNRQLHLALLFILLASIFCFLIYKFQKKQINRGKDIELAGKIMLNAGATEELAGNINKALEFYTKSIPLLPNSLVWNAYYNRARVYEYYKKDFQKALKDINSAIEFRPNDANFYGERGLIYSNLHNKVEALKNYNRAIELGSNDYRDYCNRGKEYNLANEMQKAIGDFKRCIELKPDLHVAYVQIIGILLNLKRLNEAQVYIATYKNLISTSDTSEYITYLTFQAELLLLEENYVEAIPFFEKAIELYKMNLQKGTESNDFQEIANDYYGLITSYDMTHQLKKGLKKSYELLEIAKKNHEEKIIEGALVNVTYFEKALKVE